MDISQARFLKHPKFEDCPEPECELCGIRDCPFGEPLHYDDDGCPACSKYWDVIYKRVVAELPFQALEEWPDLKLVITKGIIEDLAKKGLIHG